MTPFTPTPLAVAPLHPQKATTYACEVPESSPDFGEILYDGRCRACWLAAKAAVLNGHNPDRPVINNGVRTWMPFSDFVDRNAPFHGFAS